LKWTKKNKRVLAVFLTIIGLALLSILAFYAYVIIMPISWDFANLDWKLNALEREFHFELPSEWTCDRFYVYSVHNAFSSTVWISGEVLHADFLETQFGLNYSNKVSVQPGYSITQRKYESYERDNIRFTVYEENGNRLQIVISKSSLSNWLLLLGPKKSSINEFPHPG